MNINEVEKILDVTRANVYFYEKEGLLAPKRKENNYRDYTESDLQQLKKIIIWSSSIRKKTPAENSQIFIRIM